MIIVHRKLNSYYLTAVVCEAHSIDIRVGKLRYLDKNSLSRYFRRVI